MRRMYVIIIAVAIVSGFSWALRGSVAAASAPGPAGVSIAQGQPTRGTPPAAQGQQSQDNLDELLDPKHTVVVVHEIENDWSSVGGARDKGPGRYPTDHILQPMAELLAAARAKNVRIAHVRWTNFADSSTSNSRQQRRTSESARRTVAPNVEGTWGWEAPEIIKPMPGEWVMPKWRQDAFFGTQLDALMRWNGIKTMLIVGLGGSAGVPPTTVHASELGYSTIAVEDCLTTSDEPNWHDVAFKMIARNARMMKRKQIIDIWAKLPPRPVAPVATATEATGAGRTITYEGREIPVALEEILNPKHTVLVVNEMQKDFDARSGAGPGPRRVKLDKVLPPMARLIEAARQKQVRIAYMRFTNYADGSATADASRRSSARQPVTTLVENTPGWAIVDELKPAANDWVLRKFRADAFFATPLDNLMQWNSIKTMVIVGIGSESAVLPTVMSASNLGYNRIAVSDCLAPGDPALADEALRWIGRSATVKSSDEIIKIWRGAAATAAP